MTDLVSIAFGYLIGSVPFAYVLARRRGVDLRRAGSGNVGAANVLRTSGVFDAVLAMSLDVLKGALAVLVAQRIAGGAAAPVAAGLASILGHIYPLWLGFRGGKGVATAAGAFSVIAPWAVIIAGAVFLLVAWTTRYISAGSLSATVALAAGTALTGASAFVVAGAVIAAAIVAHRHRGNLARLISGTERRVGQRL